MSDDEELYENEFEEEDDDIVSPNTYPVDFRVGPQYYFP